MSDEIEPFIVIQSRSKVPKFYSPECREDSCIRKTKDLMINFMFTNYMSDFCFLRYILLSCQR